MKPWNSQTIGELHFLTPLVKAMRIQEKAKGVGFDWEKKEQTRS